MLGESLLNSLFTSSIPLTSFSWCVMVFFLLFPVTFMCALHLSLSYSPPPPDALAWMNTWYNSECARVCVLIFWTFQRFSRCWEMWGRFAGMRVHTVNTLKHLICPKELGVPEDVLPPLSRSLRQSLANAPATPDLLPVKGKLVSLWYAVVLKFLP